jgi:hydroxymethylpyrimidine/phosphomethylpyrimidine kinase
MSGEGTPPIALTIAGSDSGGGAGIQADLKTFHQFGVFGTSVLTAVTAQNTLGVHAWEAVSPALVSAQLDAVASDLRPAAIKSGMLADVSVISAIAAGIRQHGLTPYVLDPVMVATSGDPLITPDAIGAITAQLFPLATLVTPNLDEAALLVGGAVDSVAAMREAAERLVGEFGARAALVKGGHLAGDDATDVLFHEGQWTVVTHARIDTTSTHGTGCTLSSAITALLARGEALPDAVRGGLDFVHRALRSAPRRGAGHGPLDHFVPAVVAR